MPLRNLEQTRDTTLKQHMTKRGLAIYMHIFSFRKLYMLHVFFKWMHNACMTLSSICNEYCSIYNQPQVVY